jgi:hypothetical protein
VRPASFTFLLGWAACAGGDAGRGVRDPGRCAVPRGAAADRVHGRGRHAVHPGLSLPWLARRLRVPAPDPLEDALARATVLQQASKAGFKKLHELEYDDRHGVFALLKQRIEQRNFAAWERLGTVADQEAPSELYTRVRLEMIAAERQRVLDIRKSGTVASEVVSDVLAMLDVEESMLDISQESREEIRLTAAHRRTGDSCADLDAYRRSRRSRTRSAVTACAKGRRGSRSASVSSAETSAAATPHPAATPPPTSMRTSTR